MKLYATRWPGPEISKFLTLRGLCGSIIYFYTKLWDERKRQIGPLVSSFSLYFLNNEIVDQLLSLRFFISQHFVCSCPIFIHNLIVWQPKGSIFDWSHKIMNDWTGYNFLTPAASLCVSIEMWELTKWKMTLLDAFISSLWRPVFWSSFYHFVSDNPVFYLSLFSLLWTIKDKKE